MHKLVSVSLSIFVAGGKFRNNTLHDESTFGLKRSQSRKKISDSKKKPRSKRKKHQFSDKSRAEATNVTSLNGISTTELDLTCAIKSREREFIKAPKIENAYLAKYSKYVNVLAKFVLFNLFVCSSLSGSFILFYFHRRKSIVPPFNRYFVAIYKCFDGYVLEDGAIDRLYCRDRAWIGSIPRCIQRKSA